MAIAMSGLDRHPAGPAAAGRPSPPDGLWPLRYRILFCLGAALASWAVVIGIALVLLAALRALA